MSVREGVQGVYEANREVVAADQEAIVGLGAPDLRLGSSPEVPCPCHPAPQPRAVGRTRGGGSLEERSQRLRLLAATAESTKAELRNPSRLAQIIGARVPSDWPPETLRDAQPMFLAWHEAHPDWTGWLGWYAIRVDEEEPVLCGSVGFKGPPDASGMVEIGYSVLPEHRHVGLATEMVAKLVEWACRHPSLRCIEAETTVENRASIRVLERTGFQPVSSDHTTGTVRYRFLGARGRPTIRCS